jgi:DNA-entry nuclease
MKQWKKNRKYRLLGVVTACVMVFMSACAGKAEQEKTSANAQQETVPVSGTQQSDISMETIPEYDGEPYVVIDDNEPNFTEEELQPEAYETYGTLDALGRCSIAEASIGEGLMPTEKRGAIGQVKPTGWHTVKYDMVEGKYLYNRCHLIGYQLTAENANEKNLITGTRYMNTEGMLPFENMVADYIKETGNHVMYRVTPVFEGENLVASGVQMEAESVEDQGADLSFNVYVYNVQPGVEIDYKTGESWEANELLPASKNSDKAGNAVSGTASDKDSSDPVSEQTYILNTSSKKFHKESCSGVKSMKEKNKKVYTGKREEVIEQGYAPCGNCHP